MQIWAESGKSALPICNYSQILYQFLTFTQNLKRSRHESHYKICNLRYGTPGYRMNSYYKLEFKILFYFQNKLQSFYQQQFLQVSKPIK